MVEEIGHPQEHGREHEDGRSNFERAPPSHLAHRLAQHGVSARQLRLLGRIEVQRQAPRDDDGHDVAGKIGEEPAAPEHLHAAGALDDAARDDRRRAGDDHLVEDGRRVGQDDEHAVRDVAAPIDAERVQKAQMHVNLIARHARLLPVELLLELFGS